MGAWIETSPFRETIVAVLRSHPTWVRGLKHQYAYYNFVNLKVAPYMGAWIETDTAPLNDFETLSHPTWVRGLKPLLRCRQNHHRPVAPYMGAWIETKLNKSHAPKA